MGNILIHNARLLITMDEKLRMVKDGTVLIEDDRIVRVGKTSEVMQEVPECEHRLNCKDEIVLPGLINTHVHLAQAMLRGLVPDNIRLIDWLKNYIWPLQGNYDASDGKASAELCFLEMLKSGTTTFLETLLHPRYGLDGIAESAAKSGIRAFLAKSIMDISGYATASEIMHAGMIENRKSSLNEFEKFYKRWHGKAKGRIYVWFGLRSPGAVSNELYAETGKLARQYDTGVVMHLAEVREDINYFKSEKTTPSKFIHKLGLTGSKRVYVHCVWLSEDDMKLFAKTGTSVSHCPSSNLKLGSGVASVSKMLKLGVNVTLGTDGGPSNDNYDMIREMKLATLLQKGVNEDPTVMSVMDALKMATINGAKALGKDKEVGSIEERKKADLVIVNIKKPHFYPPINTVSNLIFAGCGEDVKHVIIDGRLVVFNGQILTMNEDEVLEKAATHANRIREKLGLPESWIPIQ